MLGVTQLQAPRLVARSLVIIHPWSGAELSLPAAPHVRLFIANIFISWSLFIGMEVSLPLVPVAVKSSLCVTRFRSRCVVMRWSVTKVSHSTEHRVSSPPASHRVHIALRCRLLPGEQTDGEREWRKVAQSLAHEIRSAPSELNTLTRYQAGL